MVRWVGAALLVGAIFFGLGILGAFGRPAAPAAEVHVVGAIADGATGLDCPAGTPVSTIWPGVHIAAFARSGDSAFVAVRSAMLDFDTVWVAASTLDLSDADLARLPVDGCRGPEPLGSAP